jgi:hypothetical protein
VIDDDEGVVNFAATERFRADLRQERLQERK